MDADKSLEDGTRDIPDLSQLALEDHAAHSSLYSACTPGPDNSGWPTPELGILPPSSRSTSDDDLPLPLPDDGNTPQPTIDSSSPPDNSHSSDPVLSSYKQEVLPAAARLTPDFIDSHNAAYNEVFREFFRSDCNCKRRVQCDTVLTVRTNRRCVSGCAISDLDEPEEVHTLYRECGFCSHSCRDSIRYLETLALTILASHFINAASFWATGQISHYPSARRNLSYFIPTWKSRTGGMSTVYGLEPRRSELSSHRTTRLFTLLSPLCRA